MTGYGRAVETVNGREFTVELRSVNNRYLDCSVRLPRMLSFAEDAVKQAVKTSVSRGKVDVFITVRSEAGDEVQVTLNKSVLQSYLTAMHQMVDEFGVNDDISVSTVSRLPEVFVIEKPQVDEETVRLRSHLKQMNTMLSTGGAVGRKLDFLLQEMNREANTIGSKCTDVNLARIVVDIKAELEKIREQTQNIE